MKTGSRGTSRNVSARIKGATDTVLGTGADSANSAYDMRSGALLTFILLFVAGWIPLIGQIVAGYVGGRKAGSPYRGFAVTTFSTFCMLFLLVIITVAIRSINGALLSDPDGTIAAMKESSPFFGQLAEAGVTYLKGILGGVDMTIDFGMYMLTIVFGVVGGVLADQSRKETRLIIAETTKVNGRRHRSIDLHRKGRTLEFESYDDYKAISVNSMPMQTYKRPVKRMEVRSTVVTGTVDTTPVTMSTPTSTSVNADTSSVPAVQEPVAEIEPKVEKKAPVEEEDISDCI